MKLVTNLCPYIFVCLYTVIPDTSYCFPLHKGCGSASTAYLVLWQTNGRCHSKLGFKEQGQVHSESYCIQARVSCEITLLLSAWYSYPKVVVWGTKDYFLISCKQKELLFPGRSRLYILWLVGFLGFNGREAQLLKFTGFVERHRCNTNFLWW